jgi:ligand-binding SRPBCC domain-containing protein
MTLVSHSSTFPVTPEALFEFHCDVQNLAVISPPLPRFALLSAPKTTELGDEQVFRLSLGPIGANWRARVTRFEPVRLIEDVQLSGPFRRWRHQHRVTAVGAGESRLTDVVAFRAIPTAAGAFIEYLLIRPGIKAMFIWRHWKTRKALRGAQPGR